MIFKTEYQRSDGAGLVNYLHKDETERVKVRRSDGERANFDDKKEFIKTTEEHEFSRGIVLTPVAQPEWEHDELDRKTREFMSQVRAERPDIDYLYSIHDTGQTDKKHVHIACAGPVDQERGLEIYDTDHYRELAHDVFDEKKKMEIEKTARQLDPEAEPLPEYEWENGVAEFEESLERDIEQDRERAEEHDRGGREF